MKNPDCNCSSEVIWRYIDRELSARDMAGVSEQIRSCDTCRGMYEEQALLARSLSSGFVDSPFGESFVARSRERFTAAGLAGSRERGIRAMGSGTKLFFGDRGFAVLRSRRFLGIAATLLLVPAILAIGFLVSSRREQSLGGLRVTGQDEVAVRIVGSSSEAIFIQPQPGGSGFEAGRIYDVPPGTTLALSLGGFGQREPAARLKLKGPARFSTASDCTVHNFHGNLISGELWARVALRGEGESFRLSSGGLHQARVIGTVFVFSARDGVTSLTVEEGLVGFGTLGENGEYRENSKVGPEAGTVSLTSPGIVADEPSVSTTPPSPAVEPTIDSSAAVKPVSPAAGASSPGGGKPSAGAATPDSLRDQLDRPANPRGN